MRIAVFGLGYVGTVSAACLARMGHEIVGVDVNEEKVAALAAGRPPVLEPGVAELIGEAVVAGRLTATTDVATAISTTDMSLICVGTPSAPSGGLSTDALTRVAEAIGTALPSDRRHVVVVRSTMLPGTLDSVVLPQLAKASGMEPGEDFGVCVQPEFLREGSAVRDFFDPPKTVIGSHQRADAEQLAALYAELPGPVFLLEPQVAELAKYVDNTFHALKVAFANEIGAICKADGIDSHAVMDVFKSDTKLNISPAYLTPGAPFGGSCLPKDVRALVHHARHADVTTPLIGAIVSSNDAHAARAYELITGTGCRKIGLFGLAFKHGTDDLRESPMVGLAERLLGRGYELLIHDRHVSTSQLLGANRAYVEEHIPHLSRLLRATPEEVLDHAEVCVIATSDDEVNELMRRAANRPVIDLVRLDGKEPSGPYEGICW